MNAPTAAPTRRSPGDLIAEAEARLHAAIDIGREALLKLQKPDGEWCFEFEADCTIPAEYILMMHFMDEIDDALQAKIAKFIRAQQVLDGHGGWPQYRNYDAPGAIDLSCTVKSYYALKCAGDDENAPHMVRARDAILRYSRYSGVQKFRSIASRNSSSVFSGACP